MENPEGMELLVIGTLTFVLCMTCWIFLDKYCIHQKDMRLRMQGIMDLKGFLSKSNCVFVLLDSSYFTRLWCAFEMAAFEHEFDKSQGTPSIFMCIRPVVAGPLVFYLWL